MFSRTVWPFKNMQVGESCTIPPERAARAKTYCHVYAAQAGKRMSWKAERGGSITVTRLPDRATTQITLTADEAKALKELFPSTARLREFCRIMAGKVKATELPNGYIKLEKRTE